MNTEEVIFSGYDEGWESELPVTLITYEDGSMDLHRQTGERFWDHIHEAAKILKERNLTVIFEIKADLRSTGAYFIVCRDGAKK